MIVPGRAARTSESIARRFAAHVADGEALAVLAEGAADPLEMAARLGELSGLRVHPTILGHAQRAAPPTALDLRARPARRAGRGRARWPKAARPTSRSAAAGELAPRAL